MKMNSKSALAASPVLPRVALAAATAKSSIFSS